MLHPITEQAVKFRGLQLLPLAPHIVGVLHGQWRKGSRGTASEGGVESEQLAVEDTDGPAITDYVMNHGEEHVVARAELVESGANEWALAEVEGLRDGCFE